MSQIGRYIQHSFKVTSLFKRQKKDLNACSFLQGKCSAISSKLHFLISMVEMREGTHSGRALSEVNKALSLLSLEW